MFEEERALLVEIRDHLAALRRQGKFSGDKLAELVEIFREEAEEPRTPPSADGAGVVVITPTPKQEG